MEKQLKEQLISLETAKLAKKKGFNLKQPQIYLRFFIDEYNCVKRILLESLSDEESGIDVTDYYEAPTQSLLQKWLRKIKGFVILVYLYDEDREDIFSYKIITRKNNKKCETPYLSYEKALEKGLQKALKLIK